ncbi:MAG: trehalose-6-phosphate synthase [Acidobacteria bacterium]|nr:trehalose-6-phosphate synthase [Acidobacteriota bacterium]
MRAAVGRAQGRRGLIVASFRSPYNFRLTAGGWVSERTVGGLVSALEPVLKQWGGTWVAVRSSEHADLPAHLDVPLEQPSFRLVWVGLKEREVSHFYHGFSNRVLWPLCHDFWERCHFRQDYWRDYLGANARMAQSLGKASAPGDWIWVHDYHLALVPHMLRKLLPKSRVALFWHIPFPPAEIFGLLPWRRHLLRGLLGADGVAFHVPLWKNHFLETVSRYLPGAEVDPDAGRVLYEGRQTWVEAIPIGIDVQSYQPTAEHVRRSLQLRRGLRKRQVILGVDRLDYTKGIVQRLEAFGRFLQLYPEFKRRVVFVQIAVPSRTRVPEYVEMTRSIEGTVGRINGQFTTEDWVPIRYIYRSLPTSELIPYYLVADVALVSPLRDGMNLVAKEYVAANAEGKGVLILSEFAGAAQDLKEALLVNPLNVEEVAHTLGLALRMKLAEKAERMARLRERVLRRDVFWWVEQNLGLLSREGRSAASAPVPRGAADGSPSRGA